jgi:hypothetical protein
MCTMFITDCYPLPLNNYILKLIVHYVPISLGIPRMNDAPLPPKILQSTKLQSLAIFVIFYLRLLGSTYTIFSPFLYVHSIAVIFLKTFYPGGIRTRVFCIDVVPIFTFENLSDAHVHLSA